MKSSDCVKIWIKLFGIVRSVRKIFCFGHHGAMSKSAKFSDAETQKRFEAALRGARIAGPQHVESLTPKRTKKQSKKKKKSKNART